jgi:DivIVA domain-containing protein
MDLTPRLLTEVEFREEWRGYKREDVDDFLARVAAALGELQERLRETAERASQAERRLLEHSDEDEIRRTLVLAQRTALGAVEEARAEAARVLADADERSRQRLADAEARLATIDAEVAERTRRDLGDLADRRAALQADVEQLTSFFEEHRARLRAELERQLADLDAPNAALAVPEPPALHEVDLEAPVHEPIDVPVPPPLDAPAVAPMEARAPTEAEVAQAREDLLEALRRAGVDELLGDDGPATLLPDAPAEPDPGDDAWRPDPEPVAEAAPEPEPEPEQPEPVAADPGAEAAEPTPLPAPEPARPQLYDADDESGELAIPVAAGEPTGAYDALADEGEAEPDDDVRWRDASGPTPVVGDEDDPFLAELRRAVTDTEPLGPREASDLVDTDGGHEEAVPSGRFRRRRGR